MEFYCFIWFYLKKVNRHICVELTLFSAWGASGWGPGLSPSWPDVLYCRGSEWETSKNDRRPLANYNIGLLPEVTDLEEGRSQIILNKYTTNTPDVTGVIPAQIWRRQAHFSNTTEQRICCEQKSTYLEWPQGRDSDAWRRQRCGARGHTWHCRSPQLSRLGFSPFARLVSEDTQRSSLENYKRCSRDLFMLRTWSRLYFTS